MKTFGLILFFSLFVCCPLSAHMDRIIELEEGKLIGLPQEYQPAFLDLQDMSLQIGSNRLKFPACVSKYFQNQTQYDVEITASWYHDVYTLPPYLGISILPKGRDHSFKLLFDMKTLNPIEFQIEIRDSDTVNSFYDLLINDPCRKSIQESCIKMSP